MLQTFFIGSASAQSSSSVSISPDDLKLEKPRLDEALKWARASFPSSASYFKDGQKKDFFMSDAMTLKNCHPK